MSINSQWNTQNIEQEYEGHTKITKKVAALEKMKESWSHFTTQKIALIGFFACTLATVLSNMAGGIITVIMSIIIGIRIIKTKNTLQYLSQKYNIPLPKQNNPFQVEQK